MMNRIDLSRADLNLLVLFEILMEERHAGRSAARLNLSPSAVSHGLGRLRKLLGDPVFLKTPKGVVPTGRATELAAPISEILARIRGVVSSAVPFDPARSTRRFVIGAPDGSSAVFLPPLLEALRKTAPGIDIGVRQILPVQGQPMPNLAWKEALTDLEARKMDIAVIPFDDIPVRFYKRKLYEEDFVIAARAGHPFLKSPGLRNYCAMQHLVVSHTGDAYGFVDIELARQGLSRRVALTVPNFAFALGVLAENDLVSALPRRFVELHGPRFGIVAIKAPIALPCFAINLVLPQVAMMDAGLSWLVAVLEGIKTSKVRKPKRSI
jgi:DNA-binding transcriptional LysR family regulator